jgi:hypothetical protein
MASTVITVDIDRGDMRSLQAVQDELGRLVDGALSQPHLRGRAQRLLDGAHLSELLNARAEQTEGGGIVLHVEPTAALGRLMAGLRSLGR